jgi:hypothetical protein
MKSFNLTLLSAAIILSAFTAKIKAEEVNLISIERPSILIEGTQRELTAEQIAELLPWAKNSKDFLTDLLDNVQGLSTFDKVDRLEDGIKQVVIESAPKNSELLMRYTLNRALIISSILDKEIDNNSVGFTDVKARVLTLSIKLALKYYDEDMATISKKTQSPFAKYGAEYFNFLTEVNKSIFDASAAYNIQRTSLEWLQWDLYRDLNNTKYASQILKINNSLKTFPAKKISDVQSLSYIRQMKKVSEQLNVIVRADIKSDPSSVLFNSQQQQKKVSSFVGNTGYSKSNGACYLKSAAGDLMFSSRVDDDACASGEYFYSRSSGACFKKSKDGEIMYSSPVNDSYCANGLYFYSRSNAGCYKLAQNGEIMYGSKVEDRLCQ